MEYDSRKCLECGIVLKGRSDKKYCSTDCRNAYNNLSNQRIYQYTSNINSILKQNLLILDTANPEGNTIVGRHKLILSGFNFSYMTHQIKTQDEQTIICCYHQGYVHLDEFRILILDENAQEKLLDFSREVAGVLT